MYGVCIAKNINNLRVGVCQPEFDQLKQCIARQVCLHPISNSLATLSGFYPSHQPHISNIFGLL